MAAAARRRRPGVLAWLALMLFASGVVRLGGHADMALAVGTATEPGTPGAEAAVACVPEEDTSALLEAFRNREARIAERESALADREQALVVARAEVEEKLTALADAERSLAEMIALAETAASDDLARLTAVYENMKPQDAAALFETMDPAFSAGFLGMMQPAAAAAIMAGLTPETAYSISVILAGRNAGAPTD